MMLEGHTWTASHVVPATATKVAARMRSRRTVAACSANMLRAKRLVRVDAAARDGSVDPRAEEV